MKRVNLLSQRIGLFFIILLTSIACDRDIQPQDSGQKSGARIRFNQTITEVVVGSPNFSLLKTAVVKAGLADALASGYLTVFAPTDAAFQAAGFANNRIDPGGRPGCTDTHPDLSCGGRT